METSRRTKRSKPGLKTGAREHVLELFVSEWAIEVLQALDRSPKLYAEMRREFRAASHAALTQTLLNLQNAGLVWRKAYPTSAARVEFSLTALGKSFIEPLQVFCEWAYVHERELTAVAARRAKQSKPSETRKRPRSKRQR